MLRTQTTFLNLNILKQIIEIPLLYHINDDGKYIFDDQEMHETLDERVNEISIAVNRLNKQNLN